MKERLSQTNYPLEFQEKLIKDLKRDAREQKRENRRLEEIDMSKYEKEEKREKTRELNESKKEKQIEWKTTHKVEIKTYNNIYYEENKEKIKRNIIKRTVINKDDFLL